jgi:hypothetical protein
MYTLYSTLSQEFIKSKFFPLGSVLCQLFSENPRKRIFLQIQYGFYFFLSFVLCVSCCTFKLPRTRGEGHEEHLAKNV